jgi:hypothetical protein
MRGLKGVCFWVSRWSVRYLDGRFGLGSGLRCVGSVHSETSAKTNTGVLEAFSDLVIQVRLKVLPPRNEDQPSDTFPGDAIVYGYRSPRLLHYGPTTLRSDHSLLREVKYSWKKTTLHLGSGVLVE